MGNSVGRHAEAALVERCPVPICLSPQPCGVRALLKEARGQHQSLSTPCADVGNFTQLHGP